MILPQLTDKIRRFLRAGTPVHPLLFGVYPVLALYYINIGEVALPAIREALITSLVITAATCFVFLLLVRSWRKAAAAISFSLILVFTYGHIYNLLEGTSIAGMILGRHRILLPVWGVTLLLGATWLVRSGKGEAWGRSLNTISFVMVILILVQAGIFFLRTSTAAVEPPSADADLQEAVDQAAERDVYYILVDAYSRQDVLLDSFRLDNSRFLSDLKDLGFYVPQCAQSNYNTTYSSMTSTLNMNYLEALGIDEGTANHVTFKPFLQRSAIFRLFRKLGYQTVTFKSLHPVIDLKDSTYYYDYFAGNSSFENLDSINFQYLFLKTTVFLPLVGYLEGTHNLNLPEFWAAWIPVNSTLNSREFRQYQQNTFALDSLESIPDLPGRKFVYAHLFVTHQPFVFYPDGSFHASLPQSYRAYRDQVLFANKRLLEIVRAILEKSRIEPVIVIQSDHSFLSGVDRVKILNAYRLPDGGNELLYPTITPVNTFRLIFNRYFGGDYEILPDISKYVHSNDGRRRDYRVAPSTCVPADQ